MTKIDKPEAADRVSTIDDEKKRALDLYDMNLQAPPVGIFDEPTRCYRINKQWAAIVMGMVSWLAEIAAWKEAQSEAYEPILEIMKFLRGDSCMNFMLRQNPTDPCLFEQSLDGGETWSLAYDYSLCASIGYQAALTIATNTQNIQNAQDTLLPALQNFNDNYAGDISDLYPELQYGSVDDGYREYALCYALRVFINQVCQKSIEFLNQQATVPPEAQVALAVTIAGVALLAIATGRLSIVAAGTLSALGAALGLSDEIYAGLINFWNSADIAAFSDDDAKADVLCQVYQALSGSQVEPSDLVAAFDGVAGSANNLAIAEACKLFAQTNAGFVAFTLALRDGINLAQLGLTEDCPCPSDVMYIDFDFAINDQNFYIYPSFSGGLPGHYVNPAWLGDDEDPDPDEYRSRINLEYEFTGLKPKIFALGVHCLRANGDGTGDNTMQVSWIQDGGASAGGGWNFAGNGEHHRAFTQAAIVSDRIRVLARVSNATATTNEIYRIRIWLSGDSALPGIPADTYPTGLPPTGAEYPF